MSFANGFCKARRLVLLPQGVTLLRCMYILYGNKTNNKSSVQIIKK